MEYLQLTSVISLIEALLTGVIMGIYYDIFRFIRRIFKFNSLAVAAQDVIFWATSAVAVFFICIRLNGGFVRIYFVIFAILGWFIYFKTAGKIIFIVFDFVLNIFSSIFAAIRKFIVKISEKIFSKL